MNDANATAITVIVVAVIAWLFYYRPGKNARRIGDIPPIQINNDVKYVRQLEVLTREDYILAETALTEVKVRTLGSTMYINGSFMYNGYVRREVSATLQHCVIHQPLDDVAPRYVFNRKDMVNVTNAAIKAAPQWNY